MKVKTDLEPTENEFSPALPPGDSTSPPPVGTSGLNAGSDLNLNFSDKPAELAPADPGDNNAPPENPKE